MDLRVSRNPNSNIKRKMIKKKNRKKKTFGSCGINEWSKFYIIKVPE